MSNTEASDCMMTGIGELSDVRPCLRQFVEAVDNDTVDARDPCVLSKFCIGEVEEYPENTTLHCGSTACAAEVTLEQEPDGAHIKYASFHLRAEPCLRQETEAGDTLPRQTDDKSCLATATAYALSKFDSGHTAADIDTWLGRAPGEAPILEGMTNLNLELLRHGYALEIVRQTGTINIRDYYEDGSTLGVEDYKNEFLANSDRKSARDFFERYTEEMFKKHVAHWRETAKLFEPYEASGQLTKTWMDVNARFMHERVQDWAIVANITNAADGAHAVVVQDVRDVAGGWVVARYFNPDFEKPSRMTEHRGYDVGEIFLLDNALKLIRPYTPDTE